MRNDAQRRLVAIRNELKAQKVAGELAYSQLLLPENAPSVSYSGTVAELSSTYTYARCRVRFTRSDGVNETPVVDFAYNFQFSPNYVEYMATQEVTITGDDTGDTDETCYAGYVAGAGSNYVDFYVDIPADISMTFYGFTSLNFSFTVQAIAMVSGTLTVERLI